MYRGLYSILFSGESSGPGFLGMIPNAIIFRIGLGLPGKEQNQGAVREPGMSMSELSRRLELSLAGVSQSVKRGEDDADFQDFLEIIDSSGITCQSP